MPKTKKQEAEEKAKAALRQRIADVVTGAIGYDSEDEEWEPWLPTGSDLSKMLHGLKIRFDPKDKKKFLFAYWSLDEYDDAEGDWSHVLDRITDFFFRNGIRA
jgi:hypothetical protein